MAAVRTPQTSSRALVDSVTPRRPDSSGHDSAAEQHARAVDSRTSRALYLGRGLQNIFELLSPRKKEHLSGGVIVLHKIFDRSEFNQFSEPT